MALPWPLGKVIEFVHVLHTRKINDQLTCLKNNQLATSTTRNDELNDGEKLPRKAHTRKDVLLHEILELPQVKARLARKSPKVFPI